jgi:glutathione peroxidase
MKSPTALILSALFAASACVPTPADNPGKSVDKAPAQVAPATDADTPDADTPDAAPKDAGVYALGATSIDGEKVSMSDYQGKVTLIVNVASRCGYTRQYAGLQKLHSEMADKGFAVLGFPSNEFGGQEPGSEAEIKEFCSSKFDVAFPMFSKVEPQEGDGQSPIYAALKAATGAQPSWNFCKYLVGKDGAPIAFYKSGTAPDSAELLKAIEAALE